MSTDWVDQIADIGLEEALRGLPVPPPEVRIVSYADFAGTHEETADPLLGTSEATILPVGGMLLMYGDGGAGKTTLTIDGVAHLGAGIPWLGIEVDRPVTTLMIENEGPRGKFRAKLAQKMASWNGHPPYAANVQVMEDPWTMFTLREEDHRMALASAVERLAIDLVVMGPLVTLGMVGGGTPDEVQDFERLIRITRTLTERAFALWVVHHENKSGDVSGAWERVPDALVHVQAQGNGHTKVHFRKARWSDRDHGRSVNLTWVVESRSFTVAEEKTYDVYAEIATLFTEQDDWRTAKEVAVALGRNEDKCRKALKDMVARPRSDHDARPLLAHRRGREGAPTAQLYRLYEGDPKLLDDPGSPGSPGDPQHPTGVGDPVIPSYKGSPVTGSPTPGVEIMDDVIRTVRSPADDSDTSTPAFD